METMRVLIAYGTSEGQTRKIAEHVARYLGSLGHDARAVDCADPESGRELDSFDVIVVASPVHQELHHRSVMAFVTAHKAALDAVRTAFISVSLSAGFAQGQVEARRYVDDFLKDMN